VAPTPVPPVAAGTVPADTSRWGGDGEVSAAYGDREQRLSADEAQMRLPVAEQPHGRAIQT
jgi:hypothetical protein